jgi:hypothetical protein
MVETISPYITCPSIEPTNNVAERALRFWVIDRYIMQGTRGRKGQQWCERFLDHTRNLSTTKPERLPFHTAGRPRLYPLRDTTLLAIRLTKTVNGYLSVANNGCVE